MIGKIKLGQAFCIPALLSLVVACDMTAQPQAPSQPDMSQRSTDNSSNNPAASESDVDEQSERSVVAERLPYAEVDEQLVYGHFAFPADMVDPLPGVIVVHERWGLDDGVRAQADRIAALGYVVLAIDLYGGRTVSDIAGARPLMVEVLEDPERAEENIRQAYQFLDDSGQAPKIAALGWSFGGGWALNTALLFPDDLDAVVVYYGQVSDDQERLGPLNVPILGLFGAKDRGVTIETVNEFEVALETLRKNYEIQIFSEAGHGFADPTAPTYNAEAAEQAWTLTVDFLQRHLIDGTE